MIGYCSTGLQPLSVAVSGQHAYLSSIYGGVRIQDVSDPYAPEEVGSFPMTAEGYDPAVAGDFAYAFRGGDFTVFDVSDPTQPVEVGSCPTQYYGSLFAAGDLVYSVSGLPGLRVFDVGDPTAPELIGTQELPGAGQEAALAGHHLYVADGLSGLTVVDVGDPTQPQLAGGYQLPGYARSVACRWPFTYVAAAEFLDEMGGLHVLDISQPSAPVLVASNDLQGEVVAVAVEGPLVAVGCEWDGVLVFRHDVQTGVAMPQAVARLTNHPNPFNPRTTIGFDLPRSGQVTVTVHDAAGRRVRTLLDGFRPAGRHQMSWDGKDQQGRPLASGVYLVNLVADGEQAVRKIVLVR